MKIVHEIFFYDFLSLLVHHHLFFFKRVLTIIPFFMYSDFMGKALILLLSQSKKFSQKPLVHVSKKKKLFSMLHKNKINYSKILQYHQSVTYKNIVIIVCFWMKKNHIQDYSLKKMKY